MINREMIMNINNSLINYREKILKKFVNSTEKKPKQLLILIMKLMKHMIIILKNFQEIWIIYKDNSMTVLKNINISEPTLINILKMLLLNTELMLKDNRPGMHGKVIIKRKMKIEN